MRKNKMWRSLFCVMSHFGFGLAAIFLIAAADAAGIAQQQEMIKQRRQQMIQQQQMQAQQQMLNQTQQTYRQAKQQAVTQQQQAMYRNVAKQQALLKQRQAFQQVKAKKEQEYLQTIQIQQYQTAQQQVMAQSVAQQKVAADLATKNVLSLSELWSELDYSTEVWEDILQQEPKQLTVERAIEEYRSQGVVIRKSPDYYVAMIDGMVTQSRDLLQQPFMDIVRLVAIIEYDFDNGHDKDALARKVLGTGKAYTNNKKRLGL